MICLTTILKELGIKKWVIKYLCSNLLHWFSYYKVLQSIAKYYKVGHHTSLFKCTPLIFIANFKLHTNQPSIKSLNKNFYLFFSILSPHCWSQLKWHKKSILNIAFLPFNGRTFVANLFSGIGQLLKPPCRKTPATNILNLLKTLTFLLLHF